MPKGVRFHRLGGPEVLEMEDVTVRSPGQGEVAMRVEAVGLNRAESMYFHGHGKGARIIFDPIGGPLLETLAVAAAPGGVIYEYGWLSMQPTPFPLMPALGKGLSITGYSPHELNAKPDEAMRAKK